jgi:acyl dehydratase
MEGIPAEAKAMIGKKRINVYEVTKKDIRRFAQAIGDTNPLYTDEEYAKKSRYGKIIAPPLFCHSLAFEDVPAEELRFDGLPDELNVPLPVQRAIGGGSEFEVGEPVSPGDVLTVSVTITDITKKEGKSGILYFISLDTIYTNQKNKIVAREKAKFIQR